MANHDSIVKSRDPGCRGFFLFWYCSQLANLSQLAIKLASLETRTVNHYFNSVVYNDTDYLCVLRTVLYW